MKSEVSQQGENRRSRLFLRALLIALAVAALAGGYCGVMRLQDRAPFLNDAVVVPGKLIRSGLPDDADLDQIKRDHGLGAIFCLRGDEKRRVVRWARREGVAVVCVRMRASDPPQPRQVGLFFDIMRGGTVDCGAYADVITDSSGIDPQGKVKFPFPVLIHCDGGSDRTGVMVALYRMAFQGWSLEDAKQEMIRRFHVPFLHPAQFDFLEEAAGSISPFYGSAGGKEQGSE